jgi:hypothetical protein
VKLRNHFTKRKKSVRQKPNLLGALNARISVKIVSGVERNFGYNLDERSRGPEAMGIQSSNFAPSSGESISFFEILAIVTGVF